MNGRPEPVGLQGAVDPVRIAGGGEEFLHVEGVEIGEEDFTIAVI